MKKPILWTIAILAILFSNGAADDQTPCANIDLAWRGRHSPIPPGRIASKQNMGSLCEIILKLGNEYVPVFAGEDFIIAGEMLKERKQITRTRIDELKAEDFMGLIPLLDSMAAITYTPSASKNRKMYMITDPLCPYCNMASEKVMTLADAHGITVKAVLYSVHGKEGEQKSIEAVCRKFTLKQYAEKEWKNLPFDESYQCRDGEKLITTAHEAVARAGIVGVPVFIFDDGRFVNGADMAAVERMLKGKE